MLKTVKKYWLYFLIIFFGLLLAINFYAVHQGIVSKTHNWFGMAIFAFGFYLYWSVEMFYTQQLRKRLDEMFNYSCEQNKRQLEINEENYQLASDLETLLKENKRLENHNVIHFKVKK